MLNSSAVNTFQIDNLDSITLYSGTVVFGVSQNIQTQFTGTILGVTQNISYLYTTTTYTTVFPISQQVLNTQSSIPVYFITQMVISP